MGQTQSARLLAKKEDLSRVEMVFAVRTLGSTMSPTAASRPSIVRTSLHNTTLTVTATNGGFPVTGETPEAAVRLLLRCIQALPGVDVAEWTPRHFMGHISAVDIIDTAPVWIDDGNIVQRGSPQVFVRVHYDEDEETLHRLLSFFAAKMKLATTSVISVRPHGYGDLVAQLTFNFAPHEVNITSEAQLANSAAIKDSSKSAEPSTGILSMLGGAGGIVSAATGLTGQTRNFGRVLQQNLGILTPLLRSQGIKSPDLTGLAAPKNAGDLVALIEMFQPALELLKGLQGGGSVGGVGGNTR